MLPSLKRLPIHNALMHDFSGDALIYLSSIECPCPAIYIPIEAFTLKCIMHFFSNPTAGKPVTPTIFPANLRSIRPAITFSSESAQRLVLHKNLKSDWYTLRWFIPAFRGTLRGPAYLKTAYPTNHQNQWNNDFIFYCSLSKLYMESKLMTFYK